MSRLDSSFALRHQKTHARRRNCKRNGRKFDWQPTTSPQGVKYSLYHHFLHSHSLTWKWTMAPGKTMKSTTNRLVVIHVTMLVSQRVSSFLVKWIMGEVDPTKPGDLRVGPVRRCQARPQNEGRAGFTEQDLGSEVLCTKDSRSPCLVSEDLKSCLARLVTRSQRSQRRFAQVSHGLPHFSQMWGGTVPRRVSSLPPGELWINLRTLPERST